MPQRPDTIDFLTGRESGALRPSGITPLGEGGKFTPDGSVQRFPGNTFIFHINRALPQWDAIRQVQETVKKSPFARFYTFLPTTSLHMTLFQGVTRANALPEGLPSAATRDEATALLLERCKDLHLPAAHRVKAQDLHAAHSLTMTGADAEQEASLRSVRKSLSAATGIQQSDFEEYVFHISLAYLLDWVSEPTAHEIADFSEELTRTLIPEIDEIPLGPVEFCHFETMHHFTPIWKFG